MTSFCDLTSALVSQRARAFCDDPPYRAAPYSKRNWGGTLHSLCSYQGKLKPAIAHFLVSEFTSPGQRVLDPLSGVGTIPLEARIQGRVGIASDLSPLAAAVSRAKLESFNSDTVWGLLDDLREHVSNNESRFAKDPQRSFGLNGPLEGFFHPQTLSEILSAREYLLAGSMDMYPVERDIIKTSIMHILHGNRPYALSRRSHPLTPFAPTGPTVYRPLIDATRARVSKVTPLLASLGEDTKPGTALLSDFRSLDSLGPVDAVITSPPFSGSIRFWSTNWMRIWFAGWDPKDFTEKPSAFLEVQQRKTFAAYHDFSQAMANILPSGAPLILHLGQTAAINMVDHIAPLLNSNFNIEYQGVESVEDTESHGFRDKGATLSHWFLFATRR